MFNEYDIYVGNCGFDVVINNSARNGNVEFRILLIKRKKEQASWPRCLSSPRRARGRNCKLKK